MDKVDLFLDDGTDPLLDDSLTEWRPAVPKKREQQLVGAPFEFLAKVGRTTTGQAAVMVALLTYRRTIVCKNRTVTLPGAELLELGVDRSLKRRALAQLVRAGLIRIEPNPPGQSVSVTLLWRPSSGPKPHLRVVS